MKEPLDDRNEVLYEINPNTVGTLDGTFSTVGEFLNAAKLTKPNNAKFCYYTSKQQPDDSWEMEKDTQFKKTCQSIFLKHP